MDYLQAQQLTDQPQTARLRPGSDAEARAIERFRDFYSELSAERVRELVKSVYAADAYLNDGLKSMRGSDAIGAYLARSAQATLSTTVHFDDLARSGQDYYFRWRMRIRFRYLKRGRTCESIGMTHVRFDPEGLVTLHQDYWDAGAGLYEHMPVLGRLIGAIRARL